MPEFLHLTGMPYAIPNANNRDIRFELSLSDGSAIMCRADYGVSAQIASSLGTALRMLQAALESVGEGALVAPQTLERVHVQKDQWSDTVLLSLTTTQGIPYIFQLPSQNAVEIGNQLKNEGSKETEVGTA